MNKPSPLVYLALVGYICAPSLTGWVMNPNGQWYRPFGIWLLVVVVAFLVQRYKIKRRQGPERP
jgi:hypothetical protein